MKQELTRLIQFAIDNGYEFFTASSVRDIESKHKVFNGREFPQYWTIKVHCLDDCDVPKEIKITHENYCNTITSKPFIEAVARGVQKMEGLKKGYIFNDFGELVREEYYLGNLLVRCEYPFLNDERRIKNGTTDLFLKLYRIDNIESRVVDVIRNKISKAIFEEKLPEFINNLLPKE